MGNQAFELAILISLKDAASAGADRVGDRLRNMGKDGKAALKQFEDLRKELKQGLVIGGAGIAGLQMLRGGIKSAGDFEAAMGDLRMSLEELGGDGRINLAKLGDEMNKAEALSLRLGNALPGTTQDFIQMLAVLKQGGLDVQTVLGGAGEAVANLAVVTGNVPAQLAEPFSQYVQQFQLKGEETTQLASTLAKLRFSTGLTPQELIEGSKFFQTRAGMPLGLTGLQGAELSGRMLATLRSFGLEGGVGGRELGGFMVGLTFNSKEQKKQLAEMKKESGISLQFFDKKGSFLGFENAFAQMEKLRKLSTEQRLKFGEKLFGKEGMGIASIMMKAGVEGWQQINQRIDKVPGLQELINQKTQTYNAKLEAVQGTLENLKATTFTPILDTLKPALDLANQFTGEMQEFAKEHPGLAKTATQLFGIGSAALIVVGSVKSLRAAWGLWKIASAVGSGEAGLLGYFVRLRTEAATTAAGVETAAVKTEMAAGRLGGRMGRALTGAMKAAIITFAIEAAVQQIMERGYQAVESRQAKADISGLEKEQAEIWKKVREFKATPEEVAKLKEIDRRIGELQVQAINATRSRDTVPFLADPSKFADDVARAAAPANVFRQGWLQNLFTPTRTAAAMMSPEKDRIHPVQEAMKDIHFKSADALGAWLEAVKKSGAYTDKEVAVIEYAATVAYPNYMKELTGLKDATAQATGGVINWAIALRDNMPQPGYRFGAPQPGSSDSNTPAPQAKPAPLSKLRVPSRAIGGDVETEGLVHLHPGERILPARVTRGLQQGALGSAGGLTIHGGVHISVPKGSRAAEEPEAFADYALKQITRKVLRQRERR